MSGRPAAGSVRPIPASVGSPTGGSVGVTIGSCRKVTGGKPEAKIENGKAGRKPRFCFCGKGGIEPSTQLRNSAILADCYCDAGGVGAMPPELFPPVVGPNPGLLLAPGEPPMGGVVLLAGWPMVPVLPPCIICSASGS